MVCPDTLIDSHITMMEHLMLLPERIKKFLILFQSLCHEQTNKQILDISMLRNTEEKEMMFRKT